MAIDYIHAEIVSARDGDSAVGLGAYVARADWLSAVTGERFRFADRSADLAALEVLLPEGAPAELRDPQRLAEAMERAETTVDRKTKRRRFKKRAQLAKHVILALPKELNDAERLTLARAWAQSQYVDRGVGAILAVHRPDDAATQNWHAHLLVTTRVVTPTGLGRKARHLNPVFAGRPGQGGFLAEADQLPRRWRAFQEAFFRAHGIDLTVDPSQAVPGVHWGRARFVPDNDREAADREAFAAAQARLRDPAGLLSELTRTRAVFSDADARRLLKRHRITGREADDLVRRTFADPEVVALFAPETGAALDRFTTRSVRAQEERTLAAADRIRATGSPAPRRTALDRAGAEQARAGRLEPEQAAALRHATGPDGLVLIQGIAGAGKSFTVASIRAAHEAAGYRVIGLAPTNAVASAMRADGFAAASTLHLELLRQEKGAPSAAPWDAETCLIVDEAAMVDTNIYERLLTRAAEAGARVILVGDDAQLASVERGGIYAALKARYGCALLKRVRRQSADWAKAASLDFAQGRIAEGLRAYAERGHLHWHADPDAAMDALVARWAADHRQDPTASRFVYAATNASVDWLNQRLQAARWADADPSAAVAFDTVRGRIALAPGDRLQFYGNDRRRHIYNGVVGTAVAVAPDAITVATDGGATVTFDPRAFDRWGLGFAGTVYRGQGRTQVAAYALYDHVLAWHARTTYVALTRHKRAVDLFVPRSLAADEAALARQMSRTDEAAASIAFATAADLAARPRRRVVEIASQTEEPETLPAASAEPHPIPAEACPAEPPAPWPFRLRGPGERHLTYDLALEADREALLEVLRTAPPSVLVETYRRLRPATTASADTPTHPAALFHRRIAGVAARRGLRPGSGAPSPTCLVDLPGDPAYRTRSDLAPWPGEIDVRPMLHPPEAVPPSAWRATGRRLRALEARTLRAIENSLQALGRRVPGYKDATVYAIANALRLVRKAARQAGTELCPGVSTDKIKELAPLYPKIRRATRLEPSRIEPKRPDRAQEAPSVSTPAPAAIEPTPRETALGPLGVAPRDPARRRAYAERLRAADPADLRHHAGQVGRALLEDGPDRDALAVALRIVASIARQEAIRLPDTLGPALRRAAELERDIIRRHNLGVPPPDRPAVPARSARPRSRAPASRAPDAQQPAAPPPGPMPPRAAREIALE